MYLSQLRLDAGLPSSYRLLAEPYRLHQAVMAAFQPDARGETRVLFRVEPEQRHGTATVLVQSEVEPDWDRAIAHFELRGARSQVKEWEPDLQPEQVLRFRLRANPTVKRNGKRLGLFGTDENGQDRQLAWLARHLKDCGCQATDVLVIDEGLVRNREPRLEFQSARFEGLLSVRDPDLAVDAVRSGIGSAKGFGFGLLSLAPAG